MKIMTKNKLSQLDYGTISSYFDGDRFSAPNSDDSLRQINGERDWESWKEDTINRFGEVMIQLDKDAVWYDKVKILNKEFNKIRADYIKDKIADIDRYGD